MIGYNNYADFSKIMLNKVQSEQPEITKNRFEKL